MKKLLAAVAALALATPASGSGMNHEVFYQIFTRSMRDSNGDRQGDLKGIEQSLPYLHRLGVTSILMTPIQPSPFYHNYFPDRPSGVDRAFGTMGDFRRLATAVHARGMKLYLDEEFQYVAYDHPWFKSALGNPRSPYSEYFFFHGPNNTQPESAVFGITVAPFYDLLYANPLHLSAAAKDFPEISFAIAHCGAGFLRETLFLAYHTDNIWVDTSGTNNWRDYTPGAPPLAEVFRDLLRTYGPRRIMFGTDSTLPHEYREAILNDQRATFDRLVTTAEDGAAIFGGNARRLFGLTEP